MFFVTKMKAKTRYEICEKRQSLPQSPVSAQDIIRLTGKGGQDKFPCCLRRVLWYDRERDEMLEFVTNDRAMVWSRFTVAAIYKDRWQIEIFFTFRDLWA